MALFTQTEFETLDFDTTHTRSDPASGRQVTVTLSTRETEPTNDREIITETWVFILLAYPAAEGRADLAVETSREDASRVIEALLSGHSV